jgi:signal transduction histidine kinase
MRIRSLRVRWMVLFMVVVLVVISTIGILAGRILSSSLQSYFSSEQTNDQELIARVQSVYHQPSDVPHVQTLAMQISSQVNARIIVVDHNQHIIADSAHKLIGKTLTVAQLLAFGNNNSASAGCPTFCDQLSSSASPIRIISTDGQIVAFGQSLSSIRMKVIDNGNQGFLLIFGIAGLVALVLTIILSGSILKPVHALTLAARQMERGDLSQRVKIKKQDEIGDLAHAFNTMADSLQRSEQLRRNLVSDVAHELRTPLTNIRGYLEALQDQVIEPDATVIASLYEEGMLLSRLVTDLQDLTLAEAGQLHLQCTPIALEDVITRAVNGLSLQAKSKNLSLSVDVPTTLPLIEADPQRVGQILRNLLSNAIKHTAPEGEIRVSARETQAGIEVCVQDTGTGIAAEHLPYLFNRFYRADPSRARATGGTGLGLAIVEQLVQAHGGRVNVESRMEQGSRFTFTLPIATI